MSKEGKIEYLRSKGWTDLWHPDYWVHYVIMAGANLDMCGVTLETAYQIQLKKDGTRR